MLDGKTLIVTGASSGIGAATAALVASQGADVISVDIVAPAMPVGRFIQADLSDRASIDRLVASLPDGIDGLANIAGLPPTRPAADVVRVNLVGLKYLTEAIVPKLANDASIVNLASLAGLGWPEATEAIRASAALDFDGVPAFCDAHAIEGARSYFFSKEALIVWTMQHRWTWRSRGIRMNAVSPGPVDTPILKDFIETLGARAEEDMRTMDRPGRPGDIAPVVAFLLSDASAWIRGTNIPVDGGMFSDVLCRMHGL
ncbi:coniferyl-alcohol dehydrogenase [Pararobbsia silviterrae]|uniref:SDR family oxidoreductase n=1 Tax=Pararobbsia silviterrae TaxID=1792498 RepID=A0A494XSB8_9BURK|nr:coniferyl-alcohol dehydrogenase [Pararobbsia silviterrae]RKP53495.1 SDR family oxidoreductase [Pararobbsia silviterrae]